jgi:hypothetical protein
MTGIRVFVGCALIGLALSACATAGENASDATKARAADRTGDQEAADPSAQAGGGGRPAKSQEPRTRIFGFEGDNENTLPEGFQVGMTGTWKASEWSVRRVEGDKALAHIGFWDEDPDDVFPVCWVKDSRALDLTLTVRLFPVAPPAEVREAVHDGAGIVVRFKNPDNYYLLRAVPHETRVRFYKVVNGKRSTLAGENLDVAVDRWHELRLRASGNVFTAYFNGKELFSHEDETFTEAGAFGLWSKPNNVTYYDDLEAVIVR